MEDTRELGSRQENEKYKVKIKWKSRVEVQRVNAVSRVVLCALAGVFLFIEADVYSRIYSTEGRMTGICATRPGVFTEQPGF